MADNDRCNIDLDQLHQQMDSLAREIVGVGRDDSRRTEIVKEPLRLSRNQTLSGLGTPKIRLDL